MNKSKKLAFVILAIAGLSGCATVREAEPARVEAPAADAATLASKQVSRPTQSYGSMGGYRYRRFVAVAASAS